MMPSLHDPLEQHLPVRIPPRRALSGRLGRAARRLRWLTDSSYGTWRGCIRHYLAQLEWLAGRLDAHTALEAAAVHRLVFVCLGNINRSAFAEAVACQHGAHAVSIGLSTTTGAPAFITAVHTATRFGLDLGQHAATDLGDYRYQAGDLLLVMEIRHLHRLRAHGIPPQAIALLGYWSRPRRLHLHDPHTLSDDYFLSCFSLIHSAVLNLLHTLREGASPAVLR